MKIELELINANNGLPEEDSWYLIYYKSEFFENIHYEIAHFTDGLFYCPETDYQFKSENILLWAKMPEYDEIMKKERER